MPSDHTRNVSLMDELNDFTRAQVASGRYQNASEVVRSALRLLQERERQPRGTSQRKAAHARSA